MWLGKFWIEDWVITLNDGTTIDWSNFAGTPPSSKSPIFAAVRADGFWDHVEGGDRYCSQRVILSAGPVFRIFFEYVNTGLTTNH